MPEIPGFAWANSFTTDGDSLYLTCDWCETPFTTISAGDSLEVIVTKARYHDRVCAGTTRSGGRRTPSAGEVDQAQAQRDARAALAATFEAGA